LWQAVTANFDWHKDRITRTVPITPSYRNTRRFFMVQCGSHFKFDHPFMEWLKDSKPKTMGDATDEWLKREKKAK
jgi:hypothetical protein